MSGTDFKLESEKPAEAGNVLLKRRRVRRSVLRRMTTKMTMISRRPQQGGASVLNSATPRAMMMNI